MATIGTVAIAVGAVPHSFNTGDTLTAGDLNGNFAALEQRLATAESKLAAVEFRTIARAHGTGPNDATVSGAIGSRHLQYTKALDATALRISWSDNIRCYGQAVSCEWEIKIDGMSCATPGPLRIDVYNDTGSVTNILRPQAFAATCFGIAKGPHTIQVYVTAPASNPAGGAGATSPGQAYTGWNAAYWSIEAEEVN
jgi:hypothetical protein